MRRFFSYIYGSLFFFWKKIKIFNSIQPTYHIKRGPCVHTAWRSYLVWFWLSDYPDALIEATQETMTIFLINILMEMSFRCFTIRNFCENCVFAKRCCARCFWLWMDIHKFCPKENFCNFVLWFYVIDGLIFYYCWWCTAVMLILFIIFI